MVIGRRNEDWNANAINGISTSRNNAMAKNTIVRFETCPIRIGYLQRCQITFSLLTTKK